MNQYKITVPSIPTGTGWIDVTVEAESASKAVYNVDRWIDNFVTFRVPMGEGDYGIGSVKHFGADGHARLPSATQDSQMDRDMRHWAVEKMV